MDILKPKRGSHDAICAINPKLEDGEIVFEYPQIDERGYGIIKIGDGVHRYNDLPAFIAAKDYYDVYAFDSFEEFPETGEDAKIYIDKSSDNNNLYRWDTDNNSYEHLCKSTTYDLTTSGSSLILRGSDGSESSVSNIGGVEIRTTDPSSSELYAGKMWIKV